MEDVEHDVYLVETKTEGDIGMESPITAGTVEYYDSGVWVTTEDRRVFFPYEQVRMIEAHSR